MPRLTSIARKGSKIVAPTWLTSSGNLATIADRGGSYTTIGTVVATITATPGRAITYAVTSGNLPPGCSLNSTTGVISGDPTDVSSNTTSTFSITPTTSGYSGLSRSFNIIVTTPIRNGSTQALAATSGYQLKLDNPALPSGTYWIKSAAMPNALQMYCDMTEDGGGYDFYAFQGNGTSVTYANSTHSGTALGLDIVYPRSKYHWRAMSNYVRTGLAGSYASYFQIVYGVHKTSGGGDFTGTIMRSTAYGSGSSSHRVNDNGKWWIRDTTFGEPNGDYDAYAWFGLQAGGYTFPNPYNLEDIGFNDGNAAYSTGAYYLVSTNAKP
jgi:hypothetical protein